MREGLRTLVKIASLRISVSGAPHTPERSGAEAVECGQAVTFKEFNLQNTNKCTKTQTTQTQLVRGEDEDTKTGDTVHGHTGAGSTHGGTRRGGTGITAGTKHSQEQNSTGTSSSRTRQRQSQH